jgi:D-lactate dehydrogenase
MIKIILFELSTSQQAFFQPLGAEYQVVYVKQPLTSENVALYADATIISTLNESDVSKNILKQMSALKHIASRTTGVDHIPLSYCRIQGISVSNVPHYGQQTVAEHTFSLLLALSHRLLHEIPRPHHGDFSPKGMMGFDLHGKTLGVIGTGNIGRFTIQIAKGFGMSILAHDIQPNQELAKEYGFYYLTKEEVLERCDILTLHVPGNESTFHLIGSAELKRMKPEAVLINTARGSVVDILALTEALMSQQISGACLDVLPHETILRNQRLCMEALKQSNRTTQELLAVQTLLKLPNVIITPHTAYNTVEAVQRILNTSLENIAAFLKNQPQNLV